MLVTASEFSLNTAAGRSYSEIIMQDTLVQPIADPSSAIDFQPHVEEFLQRGFTVIPNVLTPEQVEIGKQLLTDLFDREHVIAEQRGWRNATYQCCYMLPGKHEFFRKLPMNPITLSFVRKVLGNDCVLSSLNGLTMAPGGPNQTLHLDQAEHTPGIVININATHTLDDFTKENGAMRIVPLSHLRTGRNRNFTDEEANTIQIEAPAGSVIAFNGGAIHAGSATKPTACGDVCTPITRAVGPAAVGLQTQLLAGNHRDVER